MKKISLEQILKLHEKMANATGGLVGIRSIELLESALNNEFATFDGEDLYPSIERKCGIICFSIINNHPFVDGNKRMGVYVMLILLELNEIRIKFSQKELIGLGIGIAEGAIRYSNLFEWISNHKVE